VSHGDQSLAPYQVTYAMRVRQQLRALARAARERGDGQEFVAAANEFHRRLLIYPQFGDPLMDLLQEVGHIRIGIVPPLAMRYAVLEEKRQVFVVALPVLLPKSVNS
jgi:hypothetical protein